MSECNHLCKISLSALAWTTVPRSSSALYLFHSYDSLHIRCQLDQTFYVWNSFCSLGRSDCIFRNDGRGLSLGGAGRPDRPSPVAAHLSVHQQCLLLLLLLRPGIQHFPALPTPFRCRVGFPFFLSLTFIQSDGKLGTWLRQQLHH